MQHGTSGPTMADGATPKSGCVLKQFGCRRTGTNYLRALVERNLDDVEVWDYEGGWKHGIETPTDRAPDGYLIIAKDPYSWLLSMERYFGKSPPQKVWELLERAFTPEAHFKKTRGLLLELYTTKYAYWLERTEDRPRVVVRYEDLLEDLESVLGEIRDAFDLQPTDGTFEDISGRLQARGPGEETETKGSFDPGYYREERYLEEYTTRDLELIAERLREPGLDRVLDALGYEVRDPGPGTAGF